MNLDLETRLVKAFPSLFRGVNMSIKENLMPFGCECGDGWFDIIWNLCKKLEKTKDTKDLYFVQIKEKFGTLRAYVSCATDEQMDLIMEAEDLSEETCENCGKKGKLRGTTWFTTLCNKCWRKRNV